MVRIRWPIAVLLLLTLMIGVSVQAVTLPGGRTAYVYTTPPADSAYAEVDKEDPFVLGKDKGDNLVSLAARVFGKDLRGYQYICFDNLWTPSVPDNLLALRNLLIDTQTSLTIGERAPLGYLYQGEEAYTIVEQPDGSLTLTQYALTPVEEWKQLDNLADTPLYREVSSENQPVSPSVAQSLYR